MNNIEQYLAPVDFGVYTDLSPAQGMKMFSGFGLAHEILHSLGAEHITGGPEADLNRLMRAGNYKDWLESWPTVVETTGQRVWEFLD